MKQGINALTKVLRYGSAGLTGLLAVAALFGGDSSTWGYVVACAVVVALPAFVGAWVLDKFVE